METREGAHAGQLISCRLGFCYLGGSCTGGGVDFNVSEIQSCEFSFEWQISVTDVSVTLRSPCWCPRRDTNMASPNNSPNNARMKTRTGLNFGEAVYISLIYHIPDS